MTIRRRDFLYAGAGFAAGLWMNSEATAAVARWIGNVINIMTAVHA